MTAIFGNLECDWLADAHEWGVCQVLLNRQGAAKQNLHRFTCLYQFLTRFSFRLDDTIAEEVSDIVIELFMVTKATKMHQLKRCIAVAETQDSLGNNSTSGKNLSMENN